MSKATPTGAIKKLKDELGGQLFRREKRLIHLADLRRLMQGHLRQVQAAAEAAQGMGWKHIPGR